MTSRNYRILCIGETWLGSDARAAFMSLRRAGHSIQILDEAAYLPSAWKTKPSKVLRRLCKPLFVHELARDATHLVARFKPDCLFVFKGTAVHPNVIEHCRSLGIPTVNYYPDVSFMAHGRYIPRALPLYDHVFTTKSYGLRDMAQLLGMTRATFLEPGYDPDMHRPMALDDAEQQLYGCDATFIGTWSPSKEQILSGLMRALPGVHLKVWGSQWEKSQSPELSSSLVGGDVLGDEYAKAICGAKICLGLLSEVRVGASSGDLITARTFQIPACGTFMLHQRNPEVLAYFEEGRDAAFFDAESPRELRDKVEHYLSHPAERQTIAQGGLRRSIESGYSADGRMKIVLRWLDQHLNR